MLAEHRTNAQPARSGRSSKRRARIDYIYSPDASALGMTIRALWRKERRLGSYAPAEELCCNLEELEVTELRELKARILERIQAQLAAAQQAEALLT